MKFKIFFRRREECRGKSFKIELTRKVEFMHVHTISLYVQVCWIKPYIFVLPFFVTHSYENEYDPNLNKESFGVDVKELPFNKNVF
jgi:hypothetical protein